MRDLHSLLQADMACLLGVSGRTLRDWPSVPRRPNGSYDGPAVIAWFVERRSGKDLDLTAERARLAAVQADKGEMELKVRRRELQPLDTVIREVGTIIANANSKLRQIPHAIGQHVPQEVRLRVVNEAAKLVAEALDDLTKGTAEVLASPAGSDSERVGGHEPEALNGSERGTGPVEDE